MKAELPSASASAPGSLMVLGEYAVLHGRRAMVCSIDRRVKVDVHERNDGRLVIRSSLGSYDSLIASPEHDGRFAFVVEAARGCGFVPGGPGLGISISSGIPSGVGLSSSAAVTVGAVAALLRIRGEEPERERVFELALEAVRNVQGTGSGADVAAAVWGGLLVYRTDPLHVDRLPVTPPLVVAFSGAGVPTPAVIEQVDRRIRLLPDLFESVWDVMDASVEEAELSLKQSPPDWERFGLLLDVNQGMMEALGVITPSLAEAVYRLRDDAGILGAKVSGAGLGDCVIGLGNLQARSSGLQILDVRAAEQGLQWHE